MITTEFTTEQDRRTRQLLAAETPADIIDWLRAEFPTHTIRPDLMESWLIGVLKSRCRELLDRIAADA